MRVEEFDYTLPEERIATWPPAERGSTRLVVLDRAAGTIEHSAYASLHERLRPGDLLVLNNSRVIRARLFARKPTGARIELMLLEKHEGVQNLALYRGRLKPGDRLLAHGAELTVEALPDHGVARLSCETANLAELFEAHGSVPIPPYLKRDAEEVDRERYQTVFAELPGSVAAPTASLNLTDELLEKIKAKGVEIARVTLHVGLGTFLPIRSESFEEHVMHREYYNIPESSARKIGQVKARGGRVVAVGTTVTRALEHAAPKLIDSAFTQELSGEADIFIYPGYTFKIIDALLTNFHAPRSTVLMLTAALAGKELLRRAYQEALESDYRFLSYGDSMFIE
ncbi:tRNA preQ1(34) S-adenosylmethionine ribosyltransferase-isomerase QueA [Chlorobaculum sp. 24CR]|uniref:tRNA preQ1(34) S-adenosylmethionine ribosyltransferase-isomerase QueA n=1 Tax=Chlorobaculum sp. 24CR TaxID=2508878 RepID=UPI00100C163B|nr:tRNA preQ1(34) S-adenosylmethionine ribosyltransferase-isomerase QueA [Chlorobaculum sp. 24CR]RXK88296.1 tRNA preQ1(34) S-adenosylmethionine ribosyltransferase-isomerase QueA [Chlorobaculum sp. 24CR]